MSQLTQKLEYIVIFKNFQFSLGASKGRPHKIQDVLTRFSIEKQDYWLGERRKPIIYQMTTQSSVSRVGEMLIHGKISTLFEARSPENQTLGVGDDIGQHSTQSRAKQQMSTRRFQMLVKSFYFLWPCGAWDLTCWSPENLSRNKSSAIWATSNKKQKRYKNKFTTNNNEMRRLWNLCARSTWNCLTDCLKRLLMLMLRGFLEKLFD